MKFKNLFVALLALGAIGKLAALNLGETAPEFTDYKMVKGEMPDFKAISATKPLVVLFWNISYAGNQELNQLIEIAKKFAGKAEFIAVSCDSEESVRSFFRLNEIPCPVVSDTNLKNTAKYLQQNEHIPVTLVIGKDGQLIWRGKLANIAPVLHDINAGTYDVEGAIRREKFFFELHQAMAAKDFEKALTLVNAEMEKSPDDLQLFIFKLNLLENKLNRQSQVNSEIEAALQKKPDNPQLHELRILNLRLHGTKEQLLAAFDDIIKVFNGNFAVLKHFIFNEMKQSPGKMSPDALLKLGRAISGMEKYANDKERASGMIIYAQILDFCAAPELARQEVEKAKKFFTDPADITRADALIQHYTALENCRRQLVK